MAGGSSRPAPRGAAASSTAAAGPGQWLWGPNPAPTLSAHLPPSQRRLGTRFPQTAASTPLQVEGFDAVTLLLRGWGSPPGLCHAGVQAGSPWPQLPPAGILCPGFLAIRGASAPRRMSPHPQFPLIQPSGPPQRGPGPRALSQVRQEPPAVFQPPGSVSCPCWSAADVPGPEAGLSCGSDVPWSGLEEERAAAPREGPTGRARGRGCAAGGLRPQASSRSGDLRGDPHVLPSCWRPSPSQPGLGSDPAGGLRLTGHLPQEDSCPGHHAPDASPLCPWLQAVGRTRMSPQGGRVTMSALPQGVVLLAHPRLFLEPHAVNCPELPPSEPLRPRTRPEPTLPHLLARSPSVSPPRSPRTAAVTRAHVPGAVLRHLPPVTGPAVPAPEGGHL